MSNIKSSRIEWVDTAKAIAILSVVIGHMGFPKELTATIYAFHMPLFFMLSGMFVSRKGSFRDFLKKKAKTLLVPYLWFNVFYVVVEIITKLKNFEWGGVEYNWLNPIIGTCFGLRYGYECLGRFWFLPCLFIAELLFYAILTMKNNIQRVLFLLLLIVLGIIYNQSYSYSLPYSIDLALFAVFFLALGKWYINSLKTPIPWIRVVVIWVFFIVFVISTFLNVKFLNGCHVDMYACRIGNFIYFFLSSISGSFLIIELSKIISQTPVVKFLGKNTLTIYGFHIILAAIPYAITKIFLIRCLDIVSADSHIAFTMCKTIVCLLMMYPVCRIINRYFPWLIGKF